MQMPKLFSAGVKKAQKVNFVDILVDVILAVALIPVIAIFINQSLGNFTATEVLLLSLVTLFLVIALIVLVGKQSGLIGKKR